ncbi:hypothetical protein J6590_003270, partial [Homalodisca vitripennis]
RSLIKSYKRIAASLSFDHVHPQEDPLMPGVSSHVPRRTSAHSKSEVNPVKGDGNRLSLRLPRRDSRRSERFDGALTSGRNGDPDDCDCAVTTLQ